MSNLADSINNNRPKYGMFGKSRRPRSIWEKDIKSFNLSLFEYTKMWIWLYISKTENRKVSFCFKIGNLLCLTTNHLGIKVIGRLYLTNFNGVDYHVYSGDSEVTEQGGES